MKIELISQRSGIYGGLKRLYRLATYFIGAGHEAVVNIDDGSTNTWFDHSVPENKEIEPDIRIMPETWQKPHPTAKNILYVQAQFDPPEDRFDGIVTTTDFLAERIKDEGFTPDWIIPYGFDSEIFKPNKKIRKKINVAYMPRKDNGEIYLIKSFVKNKINFISIDGLTELEVIQTLQSSNIFLLTSKIEGFGMTGPEAALCGCILIGYHGHGAKKWLTDDVCFLTNFPQETAHLIDNIIEDPLKGEIKRDACKYKIIRELSPKRELDQWFTVIN